MTRSALDVAQLGLLGEAMECIEDVAVFVWDEDRNYIAVNEPACDLVGKTREQLLALKVGDLSDDRASPLFEDVQRRGIHTGTLQTPAGEAEFVTTRTRIAGLPYMVSLVWLTGAR